MTQTLAGLKEQATSLKHQHKARTHRKQIADLHAALDRQKEKTRAEGARADYAERQVRQIAAEMDIWKHQAKEAQAELKSLGREP